MGLFNRRNMTNIKLKILCDTSQLEAEILSATKFFNSVPELFEARFGFIDSFLEFVSLNINITTTSGAGDLRVIFKMSDNFRNFMGTLRASEGK